MKKFFLLFFIIQFQFLVFGQDYFPNNDQFDEITDVDASFLDNQRVKFQTANNDTIKMAILEKVADDVQHSEIAFAFYKSLRKYAEDSYQLEPINEVWNKKVAYFHAASFYSMAFRQKDLGKYLAAEKNYLKALEIFEKNGLQWEVAMTYNSIGFIANNNEGGLEKSIEYYEKALEAFKKLESYSDVGMVMINLATAASDLEDKELTFRYLNEAIELTEKYDDEYCLAIALSDLARNNSRFDVEVDSNENIELLERSISIHLKLKTYRNANIALIDLARIHYDQFQDFEFVDSVLQDAIMYAKKIDYSSGVAEAKYRLGFFHIREGNLPEAKRLMEEVFDFTISTEDDRFTHTVSEIAHMVFAKTGDWERAYKAIKFETDYEREQETDENRLKLSKQALEYDYQKQKEIDEIKFQNQLELEQKENERQQNIIVISLVALILVLILVVFIVSRLRIIRKQKTALDKAYELLEVRKNNEVALSNLKALRSQMNPHFIFNSLNSIQDLVLEQETNKSYDYIVLFAELVRNALNYSQKEFIPIEKEIDFIRVYLKLEKLRFGDEFDFQVDLEGSDDVKVPSLVIQPFIENSLLHGLLHKDGPKRLSIKFEVKETLVCTIEDNGIGRKQAKLIKERQGSSHESFSTNAIKERLAILSKQYGSETGFEFFDLEENGFSKGTKVIINLPYKEF